MSATDIVSGWVGQAPSSVVRSADGRTEITSYLVNFQVKVVSDPATGIVVTTYGAPINKAVTRNPDGSTTETEVEP